MTICRTTATLAASAAPSFWAGVVTAQDKDDLLFGGGLSPTGIQAPLDAPGFLGAQVAVDYLNENGGIPGRQVKVVNFDGKSDSVTVGNVAVDLIDRSAELIVAPCDFNFGDPASREAQKAGLVCISTCAPDPLYFSWPLRDKQFTPSTCNTTMGAVAADFACKERDWKKADVVTEQCVSSTERSLADESFGIVVVDD